MGWITELNAVYDRTMQNKKSSDKPLPLYHITNNAPLIITLDDKGKFLRANLLNKADKPKWQTCMPCTEKSAARTSGVEAYPLCDKLEYVAADYANYAKGKNLEEKHMAYISELESWAKSVYSNQKIKTVYSYVKKGTLISDLLKKAKIPELNVESGIENNNVFVRWEVNIRGDGQIKTWEDPEIQQLWIEYYSRTCPNKKGFCYISGKNTIIGELHGQKIRNAGDGAKIISSNDNSNYTFRGRFSDADEACQIGMEVSVKAHNALRWLIGRQGDVIANNLTIVAWSTALVVRPLLIVSTLAYWPDDNTLAYPEPEKEESYSPSETYARMVNHRLQGYYEKISNMEKIILMGLTAATPGRMSIVVYREFVKSDFFDAQQHWHEHLLWFYSYKKQDNRKTKHLHTVSAPSPLEIIKTAYGAHAGDAMITKGIQRLLPCILDKNQIPPDIERLCVDRASRLKTIDEDEREKTLETACAVFKYNSYCRKEEDYTVGLEEDRNSRDYLYGRLLAVADRIESQVLYKRKERRETNAVRYMQRFSRYPCSTWETLYVEKLRPYFSYLSKKGRDWYESLIREIESSFKYDDFVSDGPLSGEFLLGYHCQQKAFWDGVAKLKAAKQPEPIDEEEE